MPRLRSSPSVFKPSEQAYTKWLANPCYETVFSELLDPAYWLHIARKVRIGDQIEVLPDGNRWYAKLLVVSVTDNSVKVAVLSFVDFSVEQKKVDFPILYRVAFVKKDSKFNVIRISDGIIVAFHDTETAAMQDVNYLSQLDSK
jgi:hypothetical protein